MKNIDPIQALDLLKSYSEQTALKMLKEGEVEQYQKLKTDDERTAFVNKAMSRVDQITRKKVRFECRESSYNGRYVIERTYDFLIENYKGQRAVVAKMFFKSRGNRGNMMLDGGSSNWEYSGIRGLIKNLSEHVDQFQNHKPSKKYKVSISCDVQPA